VIAQRKYAALRAAALSLVMLLALILVWWLATNRSANVASLDPDYARLMGATVTQGASAFPTPGQVADNLIAHLSHPFYDKGPNDKGIGIQLLYSLGRVLLGFSLALITAVPAGFLIGMSPVFSRALDPFIQVMKPVSPLAWMPLALYTIKDSSLSAIFVIFICSVWPMLINTSFAVGAVRKEWLNVARTLEVRPLRRAFTVILPAAAPAIVAGMRISIGIAWLVIVAILLIGLIGMGLDQALGRLGRAVSYPD
jgi:nitrate/nitrite transport system permease protein